ncbi:unnamed protein product [Symbiodinium necroappetens]|uniref:Phytanoyl-CoA dioxygenase n=1 Tax=Symbiodinium necroappetens TaxID=1628268 RepID=A0A812MLR1_9DINO|nr:unnamed protein product [Symbiodinium necroappetens]
MACRIGPHVLQVGPSEDVKLMEPANDLLGTGRLKQRLKEEGYLYLQEVLPLDLVSAARKAVLASLEDSGMILEGTDGCLNPETQDQGAVPAELARCPEMLSLVESESLKGLMAEALGCDEFDGKGVRTLDYKWLRAVGLGENSGFHTDSVYLNKGSRQGLTCWIPLGDVDFQMGGLCVVGGSHSAQSYKKVRETYSQIDVDTAGIHGTGWFTEDVREILAYRCPLLTSAFQLSDVVIFRLDTMHGSLSNHSDPPKVRLSCDTRWYAADDTDGVDPRYMGEKPCGTALWWVNRHNKDLFPVSMEEAKCKWGVRLPCTSAD